MGIFGAMTTAITGLQSQSTALEHISNNIANSQTIGYKRTDTSFTELVPDSPAKQQALGVVQAFSRPTNGVQGDISNSDIATYVAINGDGFFIIGEQSGSSDGNPIFSDEDLYTRRGDFELDRHGNLVNGAGYFLKGLSVDPVTGNTTGSLPEVITISNDFLPAEATASIDYRANLASIPFTASYDPDLAGSELLDETPSLYTNDPSTDNAVPADQYVRADESATFISRSVSGGAITTFDSAGQTLNVQFRWAKIDSADDEWNLFYLEDSTATGANPMWRNVGTEYDFGTDGQLEVAVNSVTISNFTIDGTVLGDITINHGSQGMTQFAESNGQVNVTQLAQDGFAAGELTSIAISDAGRVVTSYTNGRSVDVAQVALASFNASGFLSKIDGNAFRATQESGEPILGGQGNMVGSSLESSNTDIADEFTKLIVTQQAYAANTRIISTSDEMIQEALNMIR